MIINNKKRSDGLIENQVIRRLTKPEMSAVKILGNKLNDFLVSKGFAGEKSDLRAGVTTGGTIFFMLKTKETLFGAYYAIGNGRYKAMRAAKKIEAQEAMWKIAQAI